MTVKKQETIQLSEMLSLTNVSMLYTWLKYADDEKGTNMSDDPDGKDYVGLAYNKTTLEESDNPEDYLWSRIKGDKGESGDQGVMGPAGQNGLPVYFHIKYSHLPTPTEPHDMTESPSEYIGTYTDNTEEDSIYPKDYKWARFQGIQGDKGEDGIPGGIGPDGKPAYLHIKYSNDGGKSFTRNNGEIPGDYLGQYVDDQKKDSDDPQRYKWALIKGEDGRAFTVRGRFETTDELFAIEGKEGDAYMVQGNLWGWVVLNGRGQWVDLGKIKGETGEMGPDGKPAYVHVKYSNDGGITFTDRYGEVPGDWIGIYVDDIEQDSRNPHDYKWAKIKGEKGDRGPAGLPGLQGEKGEDGIPGPPGESGKTTYFHIKYSHTENPTQPHEMQEEPAEFIGTYVDFIERDSTDPKKYKWHRLEGLQGPTGEQGLPGGIGPDGKPAYLHIKYSNDGGRTFTYPNGETPGDWIGQYTDHEKQDSMEVYRYKWSKIRGEDGRAFTVKGQLNSREELFTITGKEGEAYIVQGNLWGWVVGPDGRGTWVDLGRIKGEDGKNGITLYTWIKYADDDKGTGMSNNSAGKKYIGIAYNKTSQIEVDDYSLYTWSKIQASDFTIEGTLQSDRDLPHTGKVGSGYIINGELWMWKVDPISGLGSWANMGQFIGGSTIMADRYHESMLWSTIQGMLGKTKIWSSVNNWKNINKGDILIVPVKVGDKQNSICHIYCDITQQPTNNNVTTLVRTAQMGPEGPQGQPGLQGIQGPQGLDGIPGKNGIDGVSSYFHIKYSHKPNPTVSSDMIEVPAEYIGTYVDNTKEDSKDPKRYAWHRLEGTQGPKGEHGIPGKDGLSGKTTYLHIKYSNDGGKHFTTNNGEDTGDWLGQYTDYTQVDSMDVGKYKWKKIVGEKGEQGVPGIKGENGVSSYFHIKYSHKSNPQSPSDMQEVPAEYIGTYTDNIAKDSDNPRDYQWYRFQGLQGSKGENGIPGKNGINGETSYLHIKYSNDGGKNFTSSNGETVGEWLGQYVDYIKADSNNPKDYTWSKIKGDKGEQGIPGVKGESGASSYFHIKYSRKEKPLYSSDMQETPAEYIGTYVDTTREDSSDPKRYTWYRFQGLQGAKGDKGIPGGIGPDGKPAYLHIKYSNDGGKSFTGHNGEDVGKYIGVYTDNNKEDSSYPGDYTWSLIKGNSVIMAETSDRTYTWSQVEGMIGTTTQWSSIYNWMSMDKGDMIIIPVKISDRKYAICHIYCEVTQRPTSTLVYAKVISAQMGPEGPQGPQGPEGPVLDWVQDWDSGKTTIGGEKVLTPKIFAGRLDNIYENGAYVKKPTGVAMGERCFGTLNGFQNMAGICAYDKGKQTFSIDTEGQVYFGDPSGYNGLITYKNGRLSITAPSITLGSSDLQQSLDEKVNTGAYNSDKSGMDNRIDTANKTANSANSKVNNLESRVSSAEQKITPTSIVNSVSSAINNGSSLITSTTTLDKNGFTVKGGHFTFYDSNNDMALAHRIGYLYTQGGIQAAVAPHNKPLVRGKYHSEGSVGLHSWRITHETFNSTPLVISTNSGWTEFRNLPDNSYTNIKGYTAKMEGFSTYTTGGYGIGTCHLIRNELNSTGNDGHNHIWINKTVDMSQGDVATVIGNGRGDWGYLVADSLNIRGSKHCIQETENYGVRAINAYETAEYYFGDIGEGIIGEDGLCYIAIEDVFLEVVNTQHTYQVFLQKYGEGNMWVEDRQETYFVVKGTPNTSFGWEIKAKRKGFEADRMELIDATIDKMINGEVEIIE